MNDLLSQAIMSVSSGAIVATVMTFFMKRMISDYDSKHQKSEQALSSVNEMYHELDKRLISIQSDIRDVVKIKDKQAEQDKSIWSLESQAKASWKILDKKRASDCDE